MLTERVDQLLRAEVLLSVQRALVGAVPASLRAVTCDWSEATVTLRYVFDGPVHPFDADRMMAVGGEVAADLGYAFSLDEKVVRADHPEGLDRHFLRAWAYMRQEGPTEDFRLGLAGAG